MAENFTVFYTACPSQLVPYNDTANITCLYDNSVYEEIRDQQLFILLPALIFTVLLLFLGIPGNLTVILVYFFKMEKTSSRRFFIALAVCDLINCLLGIPVELAVLLNFLTFDHPALCEFSRFTNFFLNNASACLLAAIAVDRYKRVKHPLRPSMTFVCFRRICIVGVMFSFLGALPSIFIYGTRTTVVNARKKTFIYVLTKTCHVDDEADPVLRLVFSLYLLAVTVAIFGILVSLYTLIAKSLIIRQKSFQTVPLKKHPPLLRSASLTILAPNPKRKREHVIHHSLLQRSHSVTCLEQSTSTFRPRTHSDTARLLINGKHMRAGKTTLIMFAVTVVFLISFIPHLVIVNMRYMSPKNFTDLTPVQWSFYHFGVRSYLLNSAVNPLIYCFMNAAFRKKVKRSIMDLYYKYCKYRSRRKK